MAVRLSSGAEADEIAVRNLMTAYFYEMATWDPGIAINRFGLPVWAANGPGPATIDACTPHNWWIRGECHRYVFRTDDDAAAGYAVVCDNRGHVPAGADSYLLDFYVTGKYRRAGIGRQAATMLLERHPGRWALYTLADNTTAQAFWRTVLAAAADDVTEAEGGTEFRFRTMSGTVRRGSPS